MRTCVIGNGSTLAGASFFVNTSGSWNGGISGRVPRRCCVVFGFGAGVGGVAGCVLCCARMAGAAAPVAATTAAKPRRVRRAGFLSAFLGAPQWKRLHYFPARHPEPPILTTAPPPPLLHTSTLHR